MGLLGQQIGTNSNPCSCRKLQSTASCIERMLHSRSTCEDATASPGAASQSEGELLNAPWLCRVDIVFHTSLCLACVCLESACQCQGIGRSVPALIWDEYWTILWSRKLRWHGGLGLYLSYADSSFLRRFVWLCPTQCGSRPHSASGRVKDQSSCCIVRSRFAFCLFFLDWCRRVLNELKKLSCSNMSSRRNCSVMTLWLI